MISSLQAVNFGPGCSNRQIKTPRKARVAAALLAGLCLVVFAAHGQAPVSSPGGFLWHRPGGGDWFGNGNWSGGPRPETFSDTASFTKNNEPGSPAPAPVNLVSVL